MAITPRLTTLVVAGLALFGVRCDDNAGIREDEFACEEAAVHLDDCCPAVATTLIDCDYYEGCGTRSPTLLTVEQSRCIVELDCVTLFESGICDELRRAVLNPDSEEESSEFLESSPCPR